MTASMETYSMVIFVVNTVNISNFDHLYGGLSTNIEKQVDILISKNQVLQILYLKHCVYKTT